MARIVTPVVVLAAVAGLAAGTWWLHVRAAAPTSAASTPLVVETRPVAPADRFVRTARHVGRIEPARAVTLAFEQSGLVTEVVVDEGDRVAAGAVVARQDTRIRAAERRRLTAQREALAARIALAERTEVRQSALEGRGFAATRALDEARFGRARLQAEAAAVDAAIARLDVELAKAVLRAPFAGTVGARHVDEGATVAMGTPVLDLDETDRLEARIGVPPAVAAALQVGEAATLLHGDRRLAATLVGKRADLDARTRTVRLRFALNAPSDAPPLGSLVELVVRDEVTAVGFWAPLAALETAPKGLFRLAVAVPEDGGWRRRSASVAVVHAEAERAFVRGPVPADARMVVAGAHRVPEDARVTLQVEADR